MEKMDIIGIDRLLEFINTAGCKAVKVYQYPYTNGSTAVFSYTGKNEKELCDNMKKYASFISQDKSFDMYFFTKVSDASDEDDDETPKGKKGNTGNYIGASSKLKVSVSLSEIQPPNTYIIGGENKEVASLKTDVAALNNKIDLLLNADDEDEYEDDYLSHEDEQKYKLERIKEIGSIAKDVLFAFGIRSASPIASVAGINGIDINTAVNNLRASLKNNDFDIKAADLVQKISSFIDNNPAQAKALLSNL